MIHEEVERELLRLAADWPLPSVAEAVSIRIEKLRIEPANRWWRHGRRSTLLAAAAACLAVVAARMLVPGPLSTAQAFGMFAKALAEAHSATFRFEERDEGKPKAESEGYYLAPGKMRIETRGAGVHVTDWNAGRILSLDLEQKTAIVLKLKNAPKRGSPQLVFEKMRELFAESLDTKEDHFQRLGEKEIDGRRAIGFRYSSPAQHVNLWGDPATGLPVLVEAVWSAPASEITMSHFVLNDKLDPALFDTTPPAGYQIQVFDLEMSKLTEASLVEGLRLAADLNDSQFLDNLDTASMRALFAKHAAANKKDKSAGAAPDWLKLEMLAWTVGRGLNFAWELPESADAHYAGKGVKRGEPNRPIFWYKPDGAKAYRVIYADLSVKEAEAPPEIAGAERLEKTKPAEQKDR